MDYELVSLLQYKLGYGTFSKELNLVLPIGLMALTGIYIGTAI